MNTLRRVDDAFYVHFITFSCDHRRWLLDHDQPTRILLGILTQWRWGRQDGPLSTEQWEF